LEDRGNHEKNLLLYFSSKSIFEDNFFYYWIDDKDLENHFNKIHYLFIHQNPIILFTPYLSKKSSFSLVLDSIQFLVQGRASLAGHYFSLCKYQFFTVLEQFMVSVKKQEHAFTFLHVVLKEGIKNDLCLFRIFNVSSNN